MNKWKYARSPMLNGYRIVCGGEWKVFSTIAEAEAALAELNAEGHGSMTSADIVDMGDVG